MRYRQLREIPVVPLYNLEKSKLKMDESTETIAEKTI